MKVKDLLPQLYTTLGAMAYAGCSPEQVAEVEIVVKGCIADWPIKSVAYDTEKDKIVLVVFD